MQHEYYKEYYDLERKHWWFIAREKILSNYLSKLTEEKHFNTKELKILNIGCGPGRTSEMLNKFGQVISVEYDKFCCEFTAKKTGLEIINASITELPFENNTFDIVCGFDVIEHVEDDSLGVSEMKRVAKKEGVIMITVPAFMSLWSRHDEINHHYKKQVEKRALLIEE
jgi:SAM-dependent methyltransferase